METKVDTKNWIPVGNYIMLKPSKIAHKPNKFIVDSIMEDNAFEVIGFGSSFKAPGLKDICAIGDKVLIIEPTEIKSAGTKITIGSEEVWFYPPQTVAAVLKLKTESEYEIIPVNDFVMLERAETETKIGNIIIPTSAEEKSTHANVAIIGNGKSADDEEYKFEIEVGDEVLISKWTNNEIEINEKTYIIAKEKEILAKVEKN